MMRQFVSRSTAAQVDDDHPLRLGFLLVPGFSLVTLSCAMEAFRLTNQQVGRSLFECRTIGVGTRVVISNYGMEVQADTTLEDSERHDIIFIVSSLSAVEYHDRAVGPWLRASVRAGSAIAPIGSALVLAAKTGLLDGYLCAVNWMLLPDFTERFPKVRATGDLFCFDRDRLTSAGGLAAMDFGFAILEQLVDPELRSEIARLAEITMLARIRPSSESQRMDVSWRYQVTDPRVTTSLDLMEQHLETPMTLRQIAERVDISVRQLERLFATHLNKRPQRAYIDIRLRRAADLLHQSTDTITTIALKCGFADAPHFTRQFKASFGQTPAKARWKAVTSRDQVSEP